MNEWGEIRAVLTSDFSSHHLSLGIRVACMGAGNHERERNREPKRRYDNGNEHYGNYRYHHGYDGHYHGHYRYHW